MELPDVIIFFFTNTPTNFLKHFPSILFIHFFLYIVYNIVGKFIVFPFSRYFACFWFRRLRRGNPHRTLSRRSIAIFFYIIFVLALQLRIRFPSSCPFNRVSTVDRARLVHRKRFIHFIIIKTKKQNLINLWCLFHEAKSQNNLTKKKINFFFY